MFCASRSERFSLGLGWVEGFHGLAFRLVDGLMTMLGVVIGVVQATGKTGSLFLRWRLCSVDPGVRWTVTSGTVGGHVYSEPLSRSRFKPLRFAKFPNRFVLRLEKGEDILDSIKRFAVSQKIKAGFFEGIGSLNKVKLGHYDFTTKEYHWELFEEDLEILTLSGNISTMNKAPLPHAHVTLGRRDFTTIGGHLDEGSMANMVEMVLGKTPGKLVKAKDEAVGLNLLQLPGKL